MILRRERGEMKTLKESKKSLLFLSLSHFIMNAFASLQNFFIFFSYLKKALDER